MRFVTIRDFRSKSAQIQRDLPKEKEMVLTSNGNPIAILLTATSNTLEELMSAVRQARAIMAVNYIQKKSLALRNDAIPLKEINKEISAVRKLYKKK